MSASASLEVSRVLVTRGGRAGNYWWGRGESAGSHAMQTVLSGIHVAVISGYKSRAAAAIEYCR